MGLRKKRAIIYGLYHLGSVTTAALAKEFDGILGLDCEVDRLNEGKAPLYEPGLDALISEGLRRNHLAFTTEWEEFRHISSEQLTRMNKQLIVDQTGFLKQGLLQDPMIKTITLGRKS